MNLIFMKNCCKICKSLFEHDAKRTEVCACHDLNISVPLSHKIKHPVQKTFLSSYMNPAMKK